MTGKIIIFNKNGSVIKKRGKLTNNKVFNIDFI